MGPPFPGEFAGASLKLATGDHPYEPSLGSSPFPGEFAGASLKRTSPGH